MSVYLDNLRAALADARKAREEALLSINPQVGRWTQGHVLSAAESAARCEGTLLAVIDAMEVARPPEPVRQAAYPTLADLFGDG